MPCFLGRIGYVSCGALSQPPFQKNLAHRLRTVNAGHCGIKPDISAIGSFRAAHEKTPVLPGLFACFPRGKLLFSSVPRLGLEPRTL
jgi:hypothetical protein